MVQAVELELRKKIYVYLDNPTAKRDISNVSMNSAYYRASATRYRNPRKLTVDPMMRFYGAMKIYNMVDYIFNSYIKPRYSNFNVDDFNKMIEYIEKVNEYRDNSAHAESRIDLTKASADDCKEYVLASKMILEILSHLKTIIN